MATLEGSVLNREALILDHLPQVRLIARRAHLRCPASVELEDLISAGTLGLIQAVDRYKPERGFLLKTLAEHRIRGASLDYLRQLDPLTRSLRSFVKRRDLISRELLIASGRPPSEAELADHLGIPMNRYRAMVCAVRAARTRSLDSGLKDR